MRFLPMQSKQVDCAPFSMHGVYAAILALGTTLLAPHVAAAQTCTCADATFETAPQSTQEAESLDATKSVGELKSTLDAQPRNVVPPPPEPEDLPWCTGQNDAQCSKLPAGSTPTPVSLGASPSLLLSALAELPSPMSTACDFAEYACGGPRDAVRSKLERPPQ